MGKKKIGNIEMDVAEWGKIKGHITARGFKKNSLWIVQAMQEKHASETSDIVTQAHSLKSRIELMARLASYRCQYEKAARLGALETKAAARFERRLNKMEWAK